MTRQEQRILLISVIVAVVGGFVSVKLKGSATLDTGQSGVKGAGKVVNAALRTGSPNLWDPNADNGDWRSPAWSIVSVASAPLRARHPLYRRPRYIGENRHKVITEGWDGWYYNPPSEVYF